MTSLSFSQRINAVITYLDISEKSKQNRKRKETYIYQVRCAIEGLIEQYKESLTHGLDTWLDIQGNEHPYVYITASNKVIQTHELSVDERDGATFNLCTVVDDDPRDAKVICLKCNIFMVDRHFKVKIQGKTAKTFVLKDGVSQVCDFIKDAIMMQLNKYSLGMTGEDEHL